MAGVQQLKMVDNYQQRRSQPQQQQSQNQQRQPEQAQQLQLQINNLMTQFQKLQTTEQEKSQLLERRCKSLESALASEQEKSRSLEARCQTLESSVAAEQQRSQSRYQNHEERLKEVEDTVEQLWSISRDEVNLTKEIIGTAAGGWGYVTEANFRGRRVAAECLHTAITSQHNQQLFAKEMKMFARCRHRNLLEFIGVVPDHPAIIVTELMDTNLREALSNGRATPNHIHPICMDVAQALSYLHGIQPHPLIHRDVSAPNVLLKAVDKGGWIAKLSDLGSA
ncbi:uncharacterized protein [Dysidea avara]|uniref:uncharacterized protein n=1 Tax=Dysidea avara TaxID=196820 RepID=UPI00332B4BAC